MTHTEASTPISARPLADERAVSGPGPQRHQISPQRARIRALAANLREGDVPDPLRRGAWHWPILLTWTGVWYASKTTFGGKSWHFSVEGARLLLHGAAVGQPSGGLDLYAHYPVLQSGPLAFLLADPVSWFGGGPDTASAGLGAAELLMTLLGVLALFALERAAFALRPDVDPARIRWTVLGGGAALLPVWDMAGVYWAHYDDILALTFAALAVWAAARRRPLLLGVFLACSVDSKPWAAGFLALLFAVAGRQRRIAVAVGLALVLAAWLPFVIADPRTLDAAGFTIQNMPDSALRALGVADPVTPVWDRPVQVTAGCVLGALAVWRRRWPAVVLLGVCARLAIDPNDYPYILAGVVVGALVWDLLGARRPAPWTTLGVTALIFAAPYLGTAPDFYGRIKLLTMVLAAGIVLLGPAARLVPGRAPGPAVPDRRGTSAESDLPTPR